MEWIMLRDGRWLRVLYAYNVGGGALCKSSVARYISCTKLPYRIDVFDVDKKTRLNLLRQSSIRHRSTWIR
jgi:hypothetical protein